MNAFKNKTLVAAAVGLTMALAAGTASAQSSVTLFGQISLSLTKSTGKSVAIDTTGFGSGFGMKGTENLGGGLSAFFHLENRFDADTGSLGGRVLFDEKTIVGLKGGFGTVQLGRFGNAYDDMLGLADPFGDTVANMPSETVFGEGKWDNSFGYYTPDMGNGFSAAFTGAAKESVYIRNPYAFNLRYANGPISAGLGLARNGKNNSKSVSIAGNYDLGMAKLYAGYTKSSEVLAGAGKATNAQFGVGVPVSAAGTIKAAFSRSKNLNQLDAGNSDKVSKFGLGYWHNMSKRTMLFADVARTKAKPHSGSSTSSNAVDFGIFHTF